MELKPDGVGGERAAWQSRPLDGVLAFLDPLLARPALRQSVFGRLAGYEDVNDADRLARDPAMRWVVGGRAADDCAASASQMGRFETEWLANDENLVALADLSGRWIDRVTRASFIQRLDSSSPTWAVPPSASSPSTPSEDMPRVLTATVVWQRSSSKLGQSKNVIQFPKRQ
jgi:Transposase DDE domain group 1